MSPTRRAALISVVAATALIVIKLVAGLATNSLGLLSEAAHSGTDLAAALLAFFAIGVAHRPADSSHGFGHGKAEHLSALAECVVLLGVSAIIVVAAVGRLVSESPARVDTDWWAFAVLGLVLVVDAARATASWRAATRHGSAALQASAVHFASDFAGTIAVIAGLALTRAGYPDADPISALFVAALVILAAVRIARVNIDVLMDRTPSDAEAVARAAITGIGPQIALRRLRMREAAGTQFADVVIAVAPTAALGEGHAAADAVEAAIRRELPNADVVVHVEPAEPDRSDIHERALAAALTVPDVREIHNVRVFHVGPEVVVALHLKAAADSTLDSAHDRATAVEEAIRDACPTVTQITTHIEPLDPPVSATDQTATSDDSLVEAITIAAREVVGEAVHSVRLAKTAEGVVVFVDVGLDGATPLDEAHRISGRLRTRIRRLVNVHDVIVHTEPDNSHGRRADGS